MPARTVKPYVTVMRDPKGRSGFTVAKRSGDVITHTRLNASTEAAARAEAKAMYPGHTVWLPGDKNKPWETK